MSDEIGPRLLGKFAYMIESLKKCDADAGTLNSYHRRVRALIAVSKRGATRDDIVEMRAIEKYVDWLLIENSQVAHDGTSIPTEQYPDAMSPGVHPHGLHSLETDWALNSDGILELVKSLMQ